MNKTAKNTKYYEPYWILVAFRIILVFFPQLGYIHPDEYFQSIEVFAGNFFGLDANIPWDFNATFPIRSIGVTYFIIGTSYKVLQIIDLIVQNVLNVTVITPYTLLVVPRLFYCCLSFLTDYSMYKICTVNNEKYKAKLLVLSSSYIMLVFGSRTFSNTIELVLFSVLLYYVSDSMIFSNIVIKQHEYLSKRYSNSKTPVEKAKFHKLKLYLATHNLRNSFIISTVTVLGFFNRPTFLCFALFPVFFWLYRGLGFKSISTLLFHARILVLLVSAIPTILFLIVIDSFYFGYLTWGEIGMLDISINSFVFPSFNFIKYNLDVKNLEQHGLHPKFLHIFVNVPLLFNILGIFALVGYGDVIQKLTKGKYNLLPTVRSIKGLMLISLLAPLILLSVLSHQEPRFIIPLIFPMVYLHAHRIYEEPENKLVDVRQAKTSANKKTGAATKDYMFKLWLALNFTFMLIYGFVHQGGVYPATNYISSDIQANPNVHYDIFTGYIYNIPQAFLLQKSPDTLFYTSHSKYQLAKRVFVYEEGSKDLNFILSNIYTVLKVKLHKRNSHKLLLLLPNSMEQDVKLTANTYNLSLSNIVTFYPHLSTEALPDVNEFLYLLAVSDLKSFEFNAFLNSLIEIVKSFGLTIYQITLTRGSNTFLVQ